MRVSAYPHELATEVFKALSDALRLRILSLLMQCDELCGCEVESTLEISQSRASRALTALRRAGLVVGRRDGAWVHYSVDAQADPLIRDILRGLRKSLGDDPILAADLANLKRQCC